MKTRYETLFFFNSISCRKLIFMSLFVALTRSWSPTLFNCGGLWAGVSSYVHGKEGDGLKTDTENCLVEKENQDISSFDQHFVQIMFCGLMSLLYILYIFVLFCFSYFVLFYFLFLLAFVLGLFCFLFYICIYKSKKVCPSHVVHNLRDLN